MAFRVLFYVITISSLTVAMSVNPDESALLALKAQHNVLVKKWSHDTSFCTWVGVTCSSHRDSRVTALNISNMGLYGTIPTEISKLSFLAYLDMSDNSFTGSIPLEIGNLSQLQKLFLTNNKLTGEIPSTIFNITSLEHIDLADNELSGSLPEHVCRVGELEILELSRNHIHGEFPSNLMQCRKLKKISLARNKLTGDLPTGFWNLSAIQHIDLEENDFTGHLPTSVGNLSDLVTLNIGYNHFHGRVPSEMGHHLSSLTNLILRHNELNGEIPSSMFNLSRLQVIDVAENKFSGNIPLSIAKGLPNLQYLGLWSNRFVGKIPNSISNLSRLTGIDIAENMFTGNVPLILGNLRELEYLNLARNQFTNDLSVPEQDFLTALKNCMLLQRIDINTNPITGVLPRSFFSSNFSENLEHFVAFSCRVRGLIPNEIGNLSSLYWLSIGENDLTGVIPATLGSLRKLQRLDIYITNLHGEISDSFCNLQSLYYANMWENKLSGQLPLCFGNLSLLREIYFTRNAFNSVIPSTLWSNNRIEVIYLDNNFLHGSLSQEIRMATSLRSMDLSGNQFSGNIPSSIGQLQSLVEIELSNNKLSGPLPESLQNLKGLEYLGLSHNNLSGSIPKYLETLIYLEYFNVSFNQLYGEIPDGGPFRNFTASFFTANKDLCGASRFKIKPCKRSKSAGPSNKSVFIIYILPPIVSISIVVLLIILLLKFHGRRSTRTIASSLSKSLSSLTHQWISYYDILRATNNLDERNLIGRGSTGSVYKGIFSDGMIAAIKVFNLDVQVAAKSFETECQIMSRVHHRNLAKVITCCSNLDFKALVMEYMPNGNIDEWLYPNSTLSISQRLGMMIDVASALEYLHHGYSCTIVHGDLKPSNIFLDEDLVAHIGDFGISKILTEDQRMPQTNTLGTIGYMAPEYGSAGIVSTMADVYGFGILLIEVFTRRKPTDEMFTGELTMKRWVSESFPDKLEHIVDFDLLNVAVQSTRAIHIRCLQSVIELALDCIASQPEERLNAKDLLVRLQQIKAELLH